MSVISGRPKLPFPGGFRTDDSNGEIWRRERRATSCYTMAGETNDRPSGAPSTLTQGKKYVLLATARMPRRGGRGITHVTARGRNRFGAKVVTLTQCNIDRLC